MLRRARSGEEQAYVSLCEAMLGDVYAFAVNVIGHVPVAERIAIDALVYPLGALHDLVPGTAKRAVLSRAAELLLREASSGVAGQGGLRARMARHLLSFSGLDAAETALVLNISVESAAILQRRLSADDARPPVETLPAALLPALRGTIAEQWPDRQPRSSRRQSTAPPRQGSNPGLVALATLGTFALIAAVLFGWFVMRGSSGSRTVVIAPVDVPPTATVSGLFPIELTGTPATARPSATSTARAGTVTATATPPAGARTPTVGPGSTSVSAPTATATPAGAPSPTATATATPVQTPTATPAPTLTATPISQPCTPRIAANVAAVTLIPGQNSFFYALNQTLCGTLGFAVTSGAPWLSANSASASIATGALVAINLLTDAALLPGTGEGTFSTTVTLTPTDGGASASVSVSVIQVGSPPLITSASGSCTAGLAIFNVGASDDYGVVSVSLRYSLSSGPVTAPMVLTSGSSRSGTWRLTFARPSGVLGWAATATDGAGLARSVVVTPTGCE